MDWMTWSRWEWAEWGWQHPWTLAITPTLIGLLYLGSKLRGR